MTLIRKIEVVRLEDVLNLHGAAGVVLPGIAESYTALVDAHELANLIAETDQEDWEPEQVEAVVETLEGLPAGTLVVVEPY
jgi:hypothetical protein